MGSQNGPSRAGQVLPSASGSTVGVLIQVSHLSPPLCSKAIAEPAHPAHDAWVLRCEAALRGQQDWTASQVGGPGWREEAESCAERSRAGRVLIGLDQQRSACVSRTKGKVNVCLPPLQEHPFSFSSISH